ncbi:polysaccharide biosynthesis protein [Hallella multisaccharivorax DSM 17128]|uniref:Polysaccharide biosynthesis protein n=2 Tax=Hallella multisaccharivorax TaxID=310514 RepID=F8N5Y0_9BACT|nr:polysaccharide biosynthesis protein [Hallella multisaccharivorax DSM 17128]
MSSSNIVMYLLPLVVTPILSRLYQPEAFGDWGIFSSFIAMATLVLFAGLENAIVKIEADKLSNLLKICIICAVIAIAVLMLVFLYGRSMDISFFCSFPDIQLLAAYLIAYIPYTLGYNLCNRFSRYTALSLNNILQGSCQAGLRILAALLGLTAFNGLILGTTIALYVSAFFLVISLKHKDFPSHHEQFNTHNIKKLLVENKKFPLFDAPSSLLSFAAFNLPTIILAFYFSKASIGCFSIILQLLLLPMSLIGSAIGKVYYQQLCQGKGDTLEVTAISQKIISVTAIISILPLLVLACGGDRLIVLFLGNRWQTAGDISLCLALWSFPTILTQPLLPLFRYKNQQDTLLCFDIFYFLLGIGGLTVGCFLHLPLYTVLIVFSIGCCIAKAGLLIKIVRLSNTNMAVFLKYLPIWIVAVIILFIRLLYL